MTKLTAAFVFLTFASFASAQQFKPGDDVVVIAQPGADIKVQKEVVGKAWAGNHLGVQHVNDKWLFVTSDGRRGWIDSAGVLPIRTPEERQKAIAHFTQTIAAKPDAVALNARGLLRSANGERDAAIKDYTEAIRLNAKYWSAFNNRGNEWINAGEFDKALADYNQTLKLDEKNAAAYFNCGIARKAKGEFAKAVENYGEALKIEPKHLLAHNNLAWLLATCSDKSVRDGKRAVAVATAACEMTEWQDAGKLDTLAAAYAEAGDFENAVKWATAGIALAPEKDKAEYQARLKLYEEGKPFRERAE